MSFGKFLYGTCQYGDSPRQEQEANTILPNLMQCLTSNYHNGENTQKLLKIVEEELGELLFYAHTLFDQAIVDKATWGLDAWEAELGMQPNPALSDTDRREIIKAKLRGRGTTTKAMIKHTARAFTGGEVEIIENPPESHFIIKFVGKRGIPNNMQAFADMINLIKPAHLTWEPNFLFTWWGYLTENKVTWGMVSDMTWGEIKLYEHEKEW